MTRNDPPFTTPARVESDDLQFLRVAEVCALLRISRPTLWRLRRANEFPAPTCLSRRSIGWRRTDVDAWTRKRPAAAIVIENAPRAPLPPTSRTAHKGRPLTAAPRPGRRKRSQLVLRLQAPP